MNWIIFFNGIFKKRQSSWIPLMGGVFTAIGLASLPIKGLWKFWWLPLIIDWGCLPGLAHTAYYWLFIYKKSQTK